MVFISNARQPPMLYSIYSNIAELYVVRQLADKDAKDETLQAGHNSKGHATLKTPR
jgi:hypothetical protein